MIKNLSWTLVGNVFYSLVKWLILIMFVRSLTGEEVGMYSLALAISAPLFLFANMRLRTVYVVSDNNNFRELLILRYLVIIISLIIISIISFLWLNQYFWVVLFVSLIKVAEMISDLLYALPHKENNLTLIGKILLFKGMGILLVVGVTLLVSKSLLITLSTYVLFVFLFIFLEYKLCLPFKTDAKFEIKLIKGLLITTIPLGFVQFLGSINISQPKYFLDIFHSIEIVGIFTAITYILTIVNLIMSSLSQTYLRSIKNLIIENKYGKLKDLIFKKMGFVGFGIGIIGLINSALFGDLFLEIIYGEVISNYTFVLIILSVSITFTFFSWIFDTVLMAFESYKIQPFIAMLVFTISIPVSIILIHEGEILGATFALLFINFFQSFLKYLFTYIIIKKKEKVYETRFLS